MYTIDDLNVRLLSELKEIAEGMGVKNAKKLAKQDLVYKILDLQAVSGEPEAPAPKKSTVHTGEQPERKMRPRRRENVAPEAAVTPKVEQTEQVEETEEKEITNITNEGVPQSFTNEHSKEISKMDEEQESTPVV